MMVSNTRRLTSIAFSSRPSEIQWQYISKRTVALSFGSTVPHHRCTSLVSDHYVTQTDNGGPIHHAARVNILSSTPTQELWGDPRHVSIGTICDRQRKPRQIHPGCFGTANGLVAKWFRDDTLPWQRKVRFCRLSCVRVTSYCDVCMTSVV